jgi:hypothetical protein
MTMALNDMKNIGKQLAANMIKFKEIAIEELFPKGTKVWHYLDGKWFIGCVNNHYHGVGDEANTHHIHIRTEIPKNGGHSHGCFSYDYKEIGVNVMKFGEEDLYKSRAQFEKTYPGLKKFELNQHECALCGKKGSQNNQIENTRSIFIHTLCAKTVAHFMTVFPQPAITFEEALNKLQPLFGTGKKTAMIVRR